MNHIILYIDEMQLFVDPTVSAFDIVNQGLPNLYEKKALLIRENENKLIEIPYSLDEKSKVAIQTKVDFSQENQIKVTDLITLKGYFDYYWRYDAINYGAKEQLEFVKNVYQASTPVRNFNCEFISPENFDKPLQLKVEYNLDTPYQTFGDQDYLNLTTPWIKFFLDLDQHEERYSPVDINHGLTFTSLIELTREEASNFKYNLYQEKIEGPIVNGEAGLKIENNKLQRFTNYTLEKGRFDKTKVAHLLEARKVLSQHSGLRLEKVSQ